MMEGDIAMGRLILNRQVRVRRCCAQSSAERSLSHRADVKLHQLNAGRVVLLAQVVTVDLDVAARWLLDDLSRGIDLRGALSWPPARRSQCAVPLNGLRCLTSAQASARLVRQRSTSHQSGRSDGPRVCRVTAVAHSRAVCHSSRNVRPRVSPVRHVSGLRPNHGPRYSYDLQA